MHQDGEMCQTEGYVAGKYLTLDGSSALDLCFLFSWLNLSSSSTSLPFARLIPFSTLSHVSPQFPLTFSIPNESRAGNGEKLLSSVFCFP